MKNNCLDSNCEIWKNEEKCCTKVFCVKYDKVKKKVIKYKIMSINKFDAGASLEYWNDGATYNFDDAIEICKQWGINKGFNDMVEHLECLEPVIEFVNIKQHDVDTIKL